MAYQDIIEYLYGLQKHGVKLGLSNSFALLERLGNPQEKFPSVHVAGTNGKGSTAAFLAGMLRTAGFRTALYTSPHLVSFTERIRIDNVPITEEKVVDLAGRVREAARLIADREGAALFSPTFFEVTTAMAFTHFAEEGVDAAVVEVGMGGRLDSTNVITPLVSAITNIDIDHAEFLGTTLEQIAAEKAGIIKPGVPVVTAASQPGAVAVIENEAKAKAAPLFRMGKDFGATNIRPGRTQMFDYRGIRTSFDSVRIGMLGRHQADNACLAIAAAECLRGQGLELTDAAIRSGLESARWEGRLERVARHPDIYLDGAHNPASARALARAIREMKRDYGRLILVIGILADKDYRGILSEIVPPADHVIATRPEYSRGLDHGALASEIRRLHRSVEAAATLADAIRAARAAASAEDLILITGSLYVVGDARAALVREGCETPALKGLKG